MLATAGVLVELVGESSGAEEKGAVAFVMNHRLGFGMVKDAVANIAFIDL